MTASAPAAPKRKQYKLNGRLLGQRGLVAKACLASGLTVTQSAKIAGISRHSAGALKQNENLISPEQAQRVRERLRDKATLKLDGTLETLDPATIRNSSVSERASLIRCLTPLAGIAAPSHVELHNTVMNLYGVENRSSSNDATIPSGSQIDNLPEPQKLLEVQPS